MKYSEIEQLMEIWLEETLNLEEYTPISEYVINGIGGWKRPLI
jgi:hypothetical protein